MARSARTILTLIATERVSGPLKGIFQYLRYLDRGRWQPLVGFVRYRREAPSEAEVEATAAGIPFVVLEQSGTFDWGLISTARRVAVEHSVSLVQSHGYKTHVLAFFIKRALGVPWIGFEHGWTAENWRVRLYQRVSWLLRYADCTIAVSDDLRQKLVSLGVPPGRLLAIRNAVEEREGPPHRPGIFRQVHGIPANAPLVAVVGRISREKGHRTFVDSLRLLIQSSPEVHAAIVGDGVDAESMRRYVAAAGLTGVVHFVGYQRPVAAVYADADIIVIPSESEGISNVLLEAMAACRPVVATAVGGTPEVLGHERNGLLVPPSDPGAMADAIAALLHDKSLRDRIVEDARRHVRTHHSPVERTKRIADVYANLLA